MYDGRRMLDMGLPAKGKDKVKQKAYGEIGSGYDQPEEDNSLSTPTLG